APHHVVGGAEGHGAEVLHAVDDEAGAVGADHRLHVERAREAHGGLAAPGAEQLAVPHDLGVEAALLRLRGEGVDEAHHGGMHVHGHGGAGAAACERADHGHVGRHVEAEAAVRGRYGGREQAVAPEVAPAVERVLGVAIVLGGARRELLARQARRRLDDRGVHAIRPPAAAERRAVTQRQVSIWCSSMMLPKGSFRKSCSDWGPTTLSAAQYSTFRLSSSLRAAWMSATASATWGSEGSLPGPLANFDCPSTPIRWICAVPPTSIQ